MGCGLQPRLSIKGEARPEKAQGEEMPVQALLKQKEKLEVFRAGAGKILEHWTALCAQHTGVKPAQNVAELTASCLARTANRELT